MPLGFRSTLPPYVWNKGCEMCAHKQIAYMGRCFIEMHIENQIFLIGGNQEFLFFLGKIEIPQYWQAGARVAIFMPMTREENVQTMCGVTL